MRTSTILANESLRERMTKPYQVAVTEPEAKLPPYLESFLAHIRLLVGVPFENLVPDPRLLPSESIRFFYLDRSWTDRLVDGAIAVGKIGTREQSHHQAHGHAMIRQLDIDERIVRQLQMGLGSFEDLRKIANRSPGSVVSGFLLRSSVVAGWPHMEVRAYRKIIPELQEHREPGKTSGSVVCDPNDPKVKKQQLLTLRLERLAPSFLLALFEGVPDLVVLEEPHHGVQFGVRQATEGLVISQRHSDGSQVFDAEDLESPLTVEVPLRRGGKNVIAVEELYKRLHRKARTPAQTGGGSFALQVLEPPWRQRFEGTEDHSEVLEDRKSQIFIRVASRVEDKEIQASYLRMIAINP